MPGLPRKRKHPTAMEGTGQKRLASATSLGSIEDQSPGSVLILLAGLSCVPAQARVFPLKLRKRDDLRNARLADTDCSINAPSRLKAQRSGIRGRVQKAEPVKDINRRIITMMPFLSRIPQMDRCTACSARQI